MHFSNEELLEQENDHEVASYALAEAVGKLNIAISAIEALPEAGEDSEVTNAVQDLIWEITEYRHKLAAAIVYLDRRRNNLDTMRLEILQKTNPELFEDLPEGNWKPVGTYELEAE